VRGREADPDTPGSEPATPSVPEFDVNSLPPIESIGADTDISAFLRKGVPAALRNAALRRAWSADPAIRDFMGPTENYWDAAGPDGVPGFGDLDPNFDVKRLVSELFGEVAPERAKPDAPASSSASAPFGEICDGRDEGDKAAHASEEREDSQSHPTENAATQKKLSQAQPGQKISRRHGGAMPE
ncbi:MAG: DUF3306 domain-containing protein, partial [Xanthobacteraceae bacterium]